MADLSAYLDFSVELDFTTNNIRVTDISSYPVGVNVDIIGIVSTLQPDGISVIGDFNSPDVTWNGLVLTPGEKELRRTSASKPQQGSYTITYAVDHPDYTPTTKSKTFQFFYTQPAVTVVDHFDVFTPLLTLEDTTNYSASGMTNTAASRDWDVVVGTVTTVTGSAATLDLAYLGNYYDAIYDVELTTTLQYDHDTYDYLTVTDSVSFAGTFNADTPPGVNDLIECLDDLKAEQDSDPCPDDCCSEKDYGKAERRLSHLLHKLRVNSTEGAFDLLEEFLNLTHCDHGVNRNEIIPPYDLSSYIGNGSGWIVYNYFAPSDLSGFTIPALAGKIIKKIENSGISRKFTTGNDGDTPNADSYVYVSISGKFIYSDTIFEGTWVAIYYTNI